jgi:septal ring factor EnvC (AmiA/AmiB activator)
MKFLSVLYKNLPIILAAVLVCLFLFGIFRLEAASKRVNSLETELQEAEKRVKSISSGLSELRDANNGRETRRSRYEREVARVNAADDPVEIGCPESVHVAVDLLRDHSQRDGSE